jgi:processive 1,2-diacylglycerol beta-glucosyltransferase
MPHIVLLSESIGAGHERAAMAIEEALLGLNADIQVTRLNVLDTFRPRAAKVTRTLYLQSLAHYPNWWGKWYEKNRQKEWKGLSRSLIRGILRKEVASWLYQLAPDVVVCTHPLPTFLIAEMKKQGWQIPLCSVLTDFDLHAYWTHRGVDVYCVPVQEMKEEILRRPGNRADVVVTGIPVLRTFTETAVKKSADPVFNGNVLLIGGGLGIGVLPVVQQLVMSNIPCTLTVVCGLNQSLRRELKACYGNHSNVRILGYSRQIERLMAESDLLVTKPGGLTIAEALVMKLPMVLYTPIPGQEWRNGQMMNEYGVAITAGSPVDTSHIVHDLLRNHTRKEKMVNAMSEIRRPYASNEVVESIMDLATKGQRKRMYIMMS